MMNQNLTKLQMFIIQNILWRVDRINKVKKFLRMLGQKARKKITKS